MRRFRNFDEIISKDLKKSKKFRTLFLEGLMEEIDGEKGLSLEEALKLIIQTMGVKEFAKLTRQAPSNIVDFLKGRRHPKQSTLDNYLRPFGLKTVLHVVKAA